MERIAIELTTDEAKALRQRAQFFCRLPAGEVRWIVRRVLAEIPPDVDVVTATTMKAQTTAAAPTCSE